MTFRLRIDPIAQQRIDQFASYLRHYSEEFAIQQIDRLDYILHSNLGEAPLSWNYFPLALRIAAISFASVVEPTIGSFTSWMRTPAPSTYSPSGTQPAIRKRSTSNELREILHCEERIARFVSAA